MDQGAKGVKIVALYIFPALILMLLTVIFIVPVPKQTGTLEGNVSGINVPAQTIFIYPKGSSTFIASLHPADDGSYSIKLPVNTYIIDIGKASSTISTDVPRTIHIDKGVATRVDIAVQAAR